MNLIMENYLMNQVMKIKWLWLKKIPTLTPGSSSICRLDRKMDRMYQVTEMDWAKEVADCSVSPLTSIYRTRICGRIFLSVYDDNFYVLAEQANLWCAK